MEPKIKFLRDVKIINDTFVIYSLSDPITNEVRYIGKANELYTRIRRHIQTSRLNCNTHKNAWLKSLIKNGLYPKVCIIEKHQSNIYLNEAEIKWISYYHNNGGNLTNGTLGGDGGILSETILGKMKETKRLNPQVGWWKDKKLSQEHCKNISEAKKGLVVSDKTKVKLSESHKGLNTWSKGRKQSKKTIEKRRISQTGKPKRNFEPVLQLNLNGDIIKLWGCPIEANTVLNISRGKIHAVCIGKRKTTGGFKWVYQKDFNY